MTDRTVLADPREALAPRLRLTGEQLDSITPRPENADDFAVDWDEFEEFVPLSALAARQDEPSPALDVERLTKAIRDATWDAIDDTLHGSAEAQARDMASRIAARYLAANPPQTREAEGAAHPTRDEALDLLIDILTNGEYEKVAAEGRAAKALGLVWDETCGDRFQAPPRSIAGFDEATEGDDGEVWGDADRETDPHAHDDAPSVVRQSLARTPPPEPEHPAP